MTGRKALSGGPVRTRTGTAGLGNQSSVLLSYGAATPATYSLSVRVIVIAQFGSANAAYTPPDFRSRISATIGGDYDVLVALNLICDRRGLRFGSRIAFYAKRRTQVKCGAPYSPLVVSECLPTISNSTRISSFTFTEPPAMLTGVIPNSFCFKIAEPR
jgi:hypothetical protein